MIVRTWSVSAMFSTAKYKPDGREDSGSLTKEAVVDPCFYYSRCLETLLPSRQSLSLTPKALSPCVLRHATFIIQCRSVGLGHLCIFLTMSSIPKAFQSHTSFKRTVMFVHPLIPLPLEISKDSYRYDRAICLIQEDIFTPLQPEVDHQQDSNSLQKKPWEPFD